MLVILVIVIGNYYFFVFVVFCMDFVKVGLFWSSFVCFVRLNVFFVYGLGVWLGFLGLVSVLMSVFVVVFFR